VKDKYSYVAAFDLDKTILTINSSKLVVTSSRKIGLMSNRDFWQAVYYSIVYKFDLKDANQIVNKMTLWLNGIKESRVVDLIDSNVLSIIINLIRPEMHNIIAEHRKNNAKLVLLSSAIPYLCEPMAKHLEMDDVICSMLETKEGVFTGKSKRKLVFGTEKAVRLKEYCKENNFPLDTAWYYGDAYTDRFVLQSVGNPVCVKPEMKLKRMARKRGWEVI
jgi:HAD superfamily hydrolase (TIGR01490 family)